MKNRLHILFLNGWYPSRVMPFNGDFVQRHAEAVSLQHQVTAIHIITDSNCKQSIEIDRKELNGINTIIGYVKQTQNPLKKGYLFFSAFKKIIKEIGHIDIVHLNILYPYGIFALYLKWFRKKPFVVSEHWTGYQNSVNSIGFVEKFISKKIASSASFICPVSKNLGNSMSKIGLKGIYNIVPNVVDISVFKPIKKKDSLFTILHVSSMVDNHKNITGILNVIAELKNHISNFRFYIIGNNSNNYTLSINKLGLTNYVTIIGQIEHYKIAHYMQKSDVFVLFSNYENLPCVILESFACGTAVISSNVGGIKEYFPTDFGYLIEKKNEKKMLEKMIKLYNKPILNSEKMYSYAIRNFSKEVIAREFSNLYYQSLK